jgi:Ca-activated chloride channel family protein
VDAYSFRIGEKVIKGVVKEKQEARREYQKAKSEGRKAGLLEQERPNIFSQSLVNIPPRARVIANIEYIHMLEIDGADYLFTFPMVVAPRYIPGQEVSRGNLGRGWANDTDQVEDASRITPHHIPPGMRAGNDIEISIKLDAGMPVNNITGVTHELQVENQSESGAQISLKNGAVIPNKDFILEFRVGGSEDMLSVMTHRKKDDHGYFSMVIQPRHSVKRNEVSPREVILLLDISGSMRGRPISQLRVFSQHILGTLNPQDSFNVLAFDNEIETFAQQSMEATAANIARGQEFIRRLDSRGGTEMLPAIKKAVGNNGGEQQNAQTYLIMVTDALVGNDNRILSFIKKPKNSHLRIFPVAMGPAPNDYLIQRAAEIGRGFSLRITNEDNAGEIADRFTSKISYPIMTDIDIDWGGLGVKNVLPNPLPDLYADRPLIIIGQYQRSGTAEVQLRGNIQDTRVQTPFHLDLPEVKEDHDSLPVLWARARIRQLINKDLGDVSRTSKKEITEIGLQYQILTEYTSFIAVEKEIPKNISTTLKSQAVLLAIPEGMEHLFQGNQVASGKSVYTSNLQAESPTPEKSTTGSVAQAPQTSSTSQPQKPRPQGNSGGGGSVGLTSIFLALLLLLGRLRGVHRTSGSSVKSLEKKVLR